MIRDLDDVARIPGQSPAIWRQPRTTWTPLALLAAIAWPPVVLTLPFLQPTNWLPGRDTDWRLAVLVIGLVAVPAGLYAVARERSRTGKPSTRVGVVWRFLLYGGLLAAALQTLLTLVVVILGWGEAGAVGQSFGATETTLLIYGVAGLPFAMLIGVSYAFWAGVCIAWIAFAKRPPAVRVRPGLLDRQP